MMKMRMTPRAFTLIELLVVVGIVMVLLGLLMTAMRSINTTSRMAGSMSNMRQVGTWLQNYANDHRELIVPSRFDYSQNAYPGKVKSDDHFASIGEQFMGSWADIMWTLYVGRSYADVAGTLGHSYQNAAPDKALHELRRIYDNPFRSQERNSRDARHGTGNGIPTHQDGDGAHEAGLPGYFAANDFFDSRPNGYHGEKHWVRMAEIRVPERSIYLVDSVAGHAILPESQAWDVQNNHEFSEVDFRYSGVALMLFLDGHVDPVGPWPTLRDLEVADSERQYRIVDPRERMSPLEN